MHAYLYLNGIFNVPEPEQLPRKENTVNSLIKLKNFLRPFQKCIARILLVSDIYYLVKKSFNVLKKAPSSSNFRDEQGTGGLGHPV